MLYKTFHKLILTFILLASFDAYATQIDEERVAQLGHRFDRVTTYKAVQERAEALLAQGVAPSDITVLTDWDKTINRNGAWEQTDFDGRVVCEETKRVLLEQEVDDTLRDPQIPEIHEFLKSMGIHIIVVTARPPFEDHELAQAAGKPDLLDIRHPDNKNEIHRAVITGHIKRTICQTPDEQLIEASSRKIERMQRQSQLSLTGQKGLNKSFVHQVNDIKVVYVDGFSFVGHDKGPALMPIYNSLEKKPLHTIVIEDSPRALESYIRVLDQIQGKVHFLYYHAPVHRVFIE